VNYSIHPRQDEQAVELGRLLEGITNGIKRTLVFQANFITINSKGRILLFEIIDRLIYIFKFTKPVRLPGTFHLVTLPGYSGKVGIVTRLTIN
jgi:hypothetical protein